MSEEAESKIKQAIDLLKSKKVGENVAWLLNKHSLRGDFFPHDKDEELSWEVRNPWNIRKIERQWNFRYEGNVLQIVVANNSCGSGPDGEGYDFSDLLVVQNDVCVLKDTIDMDDGRHGSFSYLTPQFYVFSLKCFKNGPWLDELGNLRAAFERAEKQYDEEVRSARLADAAKNIDL